MLASFPDRLLVSIRLIQDSDEQGQAIANLAKVRPDLALAELATMNAAGLRNNGRLHAIFSEITKTDLTSLQTAVERLPFSLQEEAQKAIYGQLLAKDFSGTLPLLVDLPDGLKILMADYRAVMKNRQTCR